MAPCCAPLPRKLGCVQQKGKQTPVRNRTCAHTASACHGGRKGTKSRCNAISLPRSMWPEPAGAAPSGRELRASVAVMIRLVGSLDRQPDVVRLLVRHFRELDADLGQVEPRDLFVEVLRQRVDLLLVLLRFGPQLDLRQDLV